ncbi:hypothetical protein BU16DRAFT_526848 [Lophium mytilinum]|uniref:RRM domain-containing protein n=1 Tax=Lophium mytilinum TaxID=390894 RepID=A0A6A6QVD7_9PEZI|nr:hypothetical protein BU16DRAFT_526848 [Lophium mytilinum]
MVVKPFPRTAEEFESDVRVYRDKIQGNYCLEDENGEEWEYGGDPARWTIKAGEEEQFGDEDFYSQYQHENPSDDLIDAERIRQYQDAVESDGLRELRESHSALTHNPPNKRKSEENDETGAKRKKAEKAERAEKPNCAVYVTGLPPDATEEEISTEFARYGVIALSTETGNPRVKLYTDDDGNFKGDALIVYHRPESVQLAIEMADESDFRIGQKGPPGIIRVTVAETKYKKQKKKTVKVGKEKNRIVKNLEKLNAKLMDWDDDEESPQPKAASKYDKMVVLTNMFTLEGLAEDPDALKEIKTDIMDECEEKFKDLGTVANVTVFDLEQDGIATVRFSSVEAADACVKLMNGRNFDRRVIKASIADGTEKFRRTIGKRDDAEEEARLAKFGDQLEEDAE